MGADTLSIGTPYFAKTSRGELFQHDLNMAMAVYMPIVLYNIPARTDNDSLILWALTADGTGGIAGCANVLPKNKADLCDKFRMGDMAGVRLPGRDPAARGRQHHAGAAIIRTFMNHGTAFDQAGRGTAGLASAISYAIRFAQSRYPEV